MTDLPGTQVPVDQRVPLVRQGAQGERGEREEQGRRGQPDLQDLREPPDLRDLLLALQELRVGRDAPG